MRNGFYFSFIKKKSSFDQCFAISGGAGVNNLHILGKLRKNVFDCRDCGTERISFIIMVKRIQKGSVFSYKSRFSCSGTGIDTKKCFAFIRGKILNRNLMFCVALCKFLIFCFGCKKRFHSLYFKLHLYPFCQAFLELTDRHDGFLGRV